MFTTPAWQGQFAHGSPLVALLDMLPKCKEGYYNKHSLRMLGLLWCAGSDSEKVNIMFRYINPPDQIQGAICNIDKELRLMLRLLVEIATVSTVYAASNSTKEMFTPLYETRLEKII